MPRELVATAPSTLEFREYEEPMLEPDEVRVRSLFASPKHGTELRFYRANTKDFSTPFDAERRMHVEGGSQPPDFPIVLGNMAVGVVTEVGREVKRFQEGDRVFGNLPIRETHTVSEERLSLAPEGMSAEAIVYSDPASVAIHTVREARVCIGDKVAVFGLGAIGQIAVQAARLQGARWIAASDPLSLRREAASHNADLIINPLEDDAGLIIKDKTDKIGVDVSIETSGAYSGLNDALRATGYGGTIASCGYYAGNPQNLALEGEWHRNQLTLISTRPLGFLRDHPLWHHQRLENEAFQLLKDGRLLVEGLIAPIVSFEDAVEAYRRIDEVPAESIKLGIKFGQ